MTDSSSGRYRLYNVLGRPIFAAPWTLRRAALRRYQPSTPRRAAYRWLVGLSMLFGVDRLLSRSVSSKLPTGSELDFDGWLGDMRMRFAVADMAAAVFWPPQPDGARIYVHLFDGSQPIAFAKISLSESGDVGLRREERSLQEVERDRLIFTRVPRVLDGGCTGGRRFLVLEPLPLSARPPALHIDSYPRESVREYAGAVHHVETAHVQNLSWWPRYRENLDESCLLFDGELLGLLKQGLDVCRAHGDLSVNNIVRDENDLWIFDWEESCPDAPVQTDAVGFTMAVNHRATLANPDKGIDAVRQRHLAGTGAGRRLEVMTALAFRHGTGVLDAKAVIQNWHKLQ